MAREGNEIVVEWLDSKDKGKENRVNLKHVLGDLSSTAEGTEVVVSSSSRYCRAKVKDLLDWQPPKKRSRTQFEDKTARSNAKKKASQCTEKKAEALKPSATENKASNPRAAKHTAGKALRLAMGSGSPTKSVGKVSAGTNAAETSRTVFGEITNILQLHDHPSPSPSPLSARLSPRSPIPFPSPSYSPTTSSSLYSSPSPPHHIQYSSSPPASTTNPSYPSAPTTYPSYPPTPILYPSYPPTPIVYPSYPPTPIVYPSYPPAPTPYPPVHPHYSPYPTVLYPCSSHPPRPCFHSGHLSSPHFPQYLDQATPNSSCPPENPPYPLYHSTPCVPQPRRAHPTHQAMLTACEDEHLDLDKVFHNYGSSSPLLLKQEVISESHKEAKSQVNLAVKLVRRAYTRRERACSNCSGAKNKRLLSPRRMAAIKKAVYSIYPVCSEQKEKDAWKPYRIAIDSSCRQLNQPTYSTIHY